MSWCYCSGHMVEEGQPCHFDPDSACVGSECGDFVGHYDDDIDDFGICVVSIDDLIEHF